MELGVSQGCSSSLFGMLRPDGCLNSQVPGYGTQPLPRPKVIFQYVTFHLPSQPVLPSPGVLLSAEADGEVMPGSSKEGRSGKGKQGSSPRREEELAGRGASTDCQPPGVPHLRPPASEEL